MLLHHYADLSSNHYYNILTIKFSKPRANQMDSSNFI